MRANLNKSFLSHRTARKSFAIAYVIAAAVLIAAIILATVSNVSSSLFQVRKRVAKIRAMQLAEAGCIEGAERLRAYMRKGGLDGNVHNDIAWQGPFVAKKILSDPAQEFSVTVSISDEGSRLPLNYIDDLDKAYWIGLHEEGMLDAQPEVLWDRIADYIDPDADMRLHGDESHAKNKAIASPAELALFDLPLKDRQFFDAEYTVYAEDARVNINTIPAETLKALLAILREKISLRSNAIDTIVKRRLGDDEKEGTDDDGYFVSDEWTSFLSGLGPFKKVIDARFKVTSSIFRVSCTVTSKDASSELSATYDLANEKFLSFS